MMKHIRINIDGEEFISLGKLRQELRISGARLDLPGRWSNDDGCNRKAPRDPLQLYLFLGYDAQSLERPTVQFSLTSAVRELLSPDHEGGYEVWPGIKAMRDRLARLVLEMDAWDARAEQPNAI